MWWKTVSRWLEERRVKRIERHRALGTCPECRGSGFFPAAVPEIGLPVFQEGCFGCDGTGRFSDWEDRRAT